MGDAYTPSIALFPRKAYIVANPDAFSIPGIKRIVEDLGAIPLPDGTAGMANFCAAIKKHAESGHAVTLYPEAHIWPYYSGIRPFKDTSFTYPKVTGKPVFAYTTTYKKRLIGSGVKTTVYIDGPFFPDPDIPKRQDIKRLRYLCYEAMTRRAESSEYSKNRYVKVKKQAEE